jgi:formate/nitrite transporter FocA (FNT family)
VGAPEPEEIYERTRREGERRLSRPFLELVATAVAAGIDVAFGVVAFGTVAALAGRVAGAIGFGVAFVFIVVGRSELFTENFLVPIAGLERTRASWLKLTELWLVSPLFNLLGGFALIAIVTTHGVLPDGTGTPLEDLATGLDENGLPAAFLSAVAAGALITLMTWLVEGSESMGIRIVCAWIVGAVLTLAALNHVVVATLELFFGIRYGAGIGWGDLFENVGVAAVGNLVGGLVFVTMTRFGQAIGAAR